MTKKKRTKKTDFTSTNENLRVLRELVALGWAELKAKAEAEGRPLPVEPPRL